MGLFQGLTQSRMSMPACRTHRTAIPLPLACKSIHPFIHPSKIFFYPSSQSSIYSLNTGSMVRAVLDPGDKWQVRIYTAPPSKKVQHDREVFFLESVVHKRKVQRLSLIQAEDRLRPFEHHGDHLLIPSLPPSLPLSDSGILQDPGSWRAETLDLVLLPFNCL